jgi:hypothetical protein
MQHWRCDPPRGDSPQRDRPGRWQRLLRNVAADGSPLRRPIDRLESAIMLGLVAAFLIAAPLVAIFAAHEIGAAATREQTAQDTWRPVPATLMQPASAGLIQLDGNWETSWVQVGWKLPGRAPGTGLIAVALNAKKGQHVTVWVTPANKLTHPPLSSADVADRVLAAAALAPVALGVLLLIAADVVRVVANRRRMADWTRAWEAAGPKWTSRR